MAKAKGDDTVTDTADEPLVSRDERHDSIDRNTGLLTEEAQALRREMADPAE